MATGSLLKLALLNLHHNNVSIGGHKRRDCTQQIEFGQNASSYQI